MTQTLSDNLADPKCEFCHGGGYLRREGSDIAPIDIETCRCVRRRQAIIETARRLIYADLPGVYAEAEIDKLEEGEGKVQVFDRDRNRMVERPRAEIDRENKDNLRMLASSRLGIGQNVILVGPPGVGKTYGAAALLREQIRRYGVRGYYITSHRYILTMRPDQATGEEQQKLRRLCATVDILMLDDLGIEKNSAATMRELLYLIDERTKNGLPTIVTSNLRMSEVFGAKPGASAASADTREAYDIGARIYSRFKEGRQIIEWPEASADFRDELYRRSQAGRTMATSRVERAKARQLEEGEI